MTITSRANEWVKAARALSNAKARRESGLHRIEGEKLVAEALAAGARVVTGFVTPDRPFAFPADVRVLTLAPDVMASMCDCRTPQGVAATVETPDQTPPETFPVGLIAVLERVQDPGNAGAILRTADAMGCAGVLLSDDAADPYAPKTLRAAMGSTYHLPVWRGDAAHALECMARAGFSCLCGHLGGAETLPALGAGVALVIGSEGTGASEALAARCTKVRLPMPGRAESLNAAVAAGILLYEIRRSMP